MSLLEEIKLPAGEANAKGAYSSQFNAMRSIIHGAGVSRRFQIQNSRIETPELLSRYAREISVFADKQHRQNAGLWCLKVKVELQSRSYAPTPRAADVAMENLFRHGDVDEIGRSTLSEDYLVATDLDEALIDKIRNRAVSMP